MSKVQDDYRAIFQNAPAGVVLTNPFTGRFISVNPMFCSLIGYAEEELLAMSLWDLALEEDRGREMALFQRRLKEEGNCWRSETRFRRKDGEILWVEVNGSILRNAQRQPVRAMAVLVDITRHKNVEDRLQQVNQQLEQHVAERTQELEDKVRQLRRLGMELSQTEARERKRLAQLLHDDLQQILVAAKFGLEIQARKCPSNQPCFTPESDIRHLLDQALQVSRSIMVDLSPPVLSEGSFEGAVRWLAARLHKQHGLTVHLHSLGEAELSHDLKITIFGCLRELLFNIVKHSGTNTAEVILHTSSEKILLKVKDQGKGFDPAQVSSSSFGLLHLRERIEYLNGRLTITTAPGRGAEFEIDVPNTAALRLAAQSETTAHLAPADSESRQPLPDKIAILLVDDHKIVREGLASLFQYELDMEVVGHASNGQEAVRLAERLRPQVILMDISMPVMNGIEATRKIRREFPHIQVIGLSMHNDPKFLEEMLQAGARTLIPKDIPPDLLFTQIRSARQAAVP